MRLPHPFVRLPFTVDAETLAPHLAVLPYTRRIMGALESVIGRSRLMRVPEEGDLDAHVDVAYYWRDHLRVHVPVVSDPSVEVHCGYESVHMAPGEVWVFAEHEIDEVVALPGIRYPEIVEPGADLADSAFVLPDAALTDVPAELRS